MAFWLIETEDQLAELKLKNYQDIFLEPIYLNDKYHSTLNDICALYIKPVDHKKGYIINISHTDGLSLQKTAVKAILNEFKTIYVRDKKALLYHLSLKNSIDISLFCFEYSEPTTGAHTYYYNKFPTKLDINYLIPIVKHYEKLENLFEIVQPSLQYEVNEFFNNKATLAFLSIEKNGIRIKQDKFEKFFEPQHEEYSVCNNTIYTRYNLYTTTRRPSNTFNSINFAALNKDNKCRESFIPQNDKFVEIDISAYHPTLASKLVKYDFDNLTPYQWFSEVSGLSIEEAKLLMFRQLYGGVYDDYKHLDFFVKIQEFVNKMWTQFNTEGYIECPISKYKFKKECLKDMNPQKLFNYLLQCLETSNNVNLIWEMIKLLKGKNTKLVLYTYDSFTFDVDDDEEILTEIKNIFKKHNLKIKTKTNRTLHFG